jgi:hypothetical protein
MASLPRELTTREGDRHGSELGDVIRQLASDSQGVAFAALRAMARKLEKYNCSFLDLADHIENGSGLSDADKQKIRSEIENARAIGYEEGVKAAESKQHGTGAFRNTDGALEWTEVALYCQRQKHRLPEKNHEFIDDMAARTVYGREPTPKQHRYLHFLFFRLGGKIT